MAQLARLPAGGNSPGDGLAGQRTRHPGVRQWRGCTPLSCRRPRLRSARGGAELRPGRDACVGNSRGMTGVTRDENRHRNARLPSHETPDSRRDQRVAHTPNVTVKAPRTSSAPAARTYSCIARCVGLHRCTERSQGTDAVQHPGHHLTWYPQDGEDQEAIAHGHGDAPGAGRRCGPRRRSADRRRRRRRWRAQHGEHASTGALRRVHDPEGPLGVGPLPPPTRPVTTPRCWRSHHHVAPGAPIA